MCVRVCGSLLGWLCGATAGTGGTLAGVARYLKAQSPGIKIFLADPPGSVLHRFVQSKGAVVGERSGSSITEGIGQVVGADRSRARVGLVVVCW